MIPLGMKCGKGIHRIMNDTRLQTLRESMFTGTMRDTVNSIESYFEIRLEKPKSLPTNSKCASFYEQYLKYLKDGKTKMDSAYQADLDYSSDILIGKRKLPLEDARFLGHMDSLLDLTVDEEDILQVYFFYRQFTERRERS